MVLGTYTDMEHEVATENKFRKTRTMPKDRREEKEKTDRDAMRPSQNYPHL